MKDTKEGRKFQADSRDREDSIYSTETHGQEGSSKVPFKV